MQPPPPPAGNSSRRWAVYFLLLALLAGVGVAINIAYNLSLQLKPEQVAAARARWQEHGARDYDLKYRVKRDDTPQAGEYDYVVQVRGGKVVFVGCNGTILLMPPATALAAGLVVRALPHEDPRAYGVEAMLAEIESTLRQDAESGNRRTYATASFDAGDGHPIHYVHRVGGTHQRVEWMIQLTRVGE